MISTAEFPPKQTSARQASLSGLKTLVQAEAHAWRCFLAVCISMLLNFLLAIANANGIGMNNNLVTVIQVIVTGASACMVLFWPIRVTKLEQYSAFAIVLSLIMTLMVNEFNPRLFYDFLVIPLYIALGRSARFTKPRWMDALLLTVLAITLLEIAAPTLFVRVVNPGKYFLATRSWVAAQNGAVAETGLYVGAFRGGGSVFALSDHRISGPFLEPLSLGYFGVLMTIYYVGIADVSVIKRILTVGASLFLSLASDSRAATGMIVLSALLLASRIRLPAMVMWMMPVLVFISLWIFYIFSDGVSLGDSASRVAITFDALKEFNVWDIIVGRVNSDRIGDSGFIYLARGLGLIGSVVGIYFFSGIISCRKSQNCIIYAVFSIYIVQLLAFGLAVFSIKSASLAGYLIGISSWNMKVSFKNRGILFRSRE